MSPDRVKEIVKNTALVIGAFVITHDVGVIVGNAVRSAEASPQAITSEYIPPTGPELDDLITRPAEWTLHPLGEKINSILSEPFILKLN
jgi:hypothetical protein